MDSINIRLKKLELTNFRGFRSAEVSFDTEKNVIVLIADNGMGKTSILDAAAEFLRYFRHEAIYAGHRAPTSFHGEVNPQYDVTNGTLLSVGKAILEIEYPFISAELHEWIFQCIDWLNEIEVPGHQAKLVYDFEEGDFVILIVQEKEEGSEDSDEFHYILPDMLRKDLKKETSFKGKQTPLFQLLEADLTVSTHKELEFAHKTKEDAQWQLSPAFQPNAFSSTHKGDVELKFEMNAERSDSLNFEVINPLPATERDAIGLRKEGKAFIEDFRKVVQRSSPYESKGADLTLPLLVYYGGSAINTKFDKKLKLPYRLGWFQPYAHALEPDRFDFAEFFSWAMYTKETAPHQWNLLKKIVLDVLNPPSEGAKIYTDLLIEAQELVVVKKVGEGNGQRVMLKQLSAGEKNILALVCDLVKRAIQLNPHLVPEVQEDKKEEENEKSDETVNFLNPVPGIVLIDEIDLHLHPKWQRGILTKLQKYFPDVQFFVTTHSPFVLQSLLKRRSTIIRLPFESGKNKWEGLIGWELSEVAEELFDSDEISDKLNKVIRKFRSAVLKDDFEKIVKYYNWLTENMKNDNPRRKAIEMQYEIAKSIYNDEEAE